MSLPQNWASMPSVTNAGTKEVAVSGFTFIVMPFSTNGNQLGSSGVDSEQINISYRVIDKTDYNAESNPKTTYGASFGLMLYTALRRLAYDPVIAPWSSGVYCVGKWIPFGSTSVRVMSASFSVENEKTPDVFVLTLECSVTYGATTYEGSNKSERKMRPSFRDAPWNLPPRLSIRNGTEDFVNGFAYSNKRVYSVAKDQKLGANSVRGFTLFKENEFTSVVNTAGEPFLSPVGQKIAVAQIEIEANFTKDNVPQLPSDVSSQVNDGDFSINYSGVMLLKCAAGTLVLSGWVVSPEVWIQEVPWFPKEKHPLGFTYGDLYQALSAKMASKAAINETSETIMVKKEYAYFATRATFSYRASGFAALVPNRGRNHMKDGKLVPINKLEMGRVDECFLDRDGKAMDGKTLTCIGYSSYYCGRDVTAFLNTIVSKKGNSDVTWAVKRNK